MVISEGETRSESRDRQPWSLVPFLIAIMTVVGVSIAAYTRHLPNLFGSHGIDKVLHGVMGVILTLLLARVLHHRGRASSRLGVWLAAGLVLSTLSIDEYLQRFSPARTSEWGDLIADALGVAIAIAVIHYRRGRGLRELS